MNDKANARSLSCNCAAAGRESAAAAAVRALSEQCDIDPENFYLPHGLPPHTYAIRPADGPPELVTVFTAYTTQPPPAEAPDDSDDVCREDPDDRLGPAPAGTAGLGVVVLRKARIAASPRCSWGDEREGGARRTGQGSRVPAMGSNAHTRARVRRTRRRRRVSSSTPLCRTGRSAVAGGRAPASRHVCRARGRAGGPTHGSIFVSACARTHARTHG